MPLDGAPDTTTRRQTLIQPARSPRSPAAGIQRSVTDHNMSDHRSEREKPLREFGWSVMNLARVVSLA
jgi:hypothetical protein